MDFLHTVLLGGQAPAPGGQTGDQFPMMIMMFAIIFFIFYLLIMRPQKREQQRLEQLRSSLKKGDKVVSIGGIHGTVTAVDTTNNIVTVQVDKNVKLDFSKAAISTVVRKEDKQETGETGKEEPQKS